MGRKGLHPKEEGGWRGFSERNDWSKALASLPHQPEVTSACPLHTEILATTQAETLVAQSNIREHEGPTGVKSYRWNLTGTPWAFVPSPSSLQTPGLSYKTSIFLPKYLSCDLLAQKYLNGLPSAQTFPWPKRFLMIIWFNLFLQTDLSTALATLRFSTLSKHALIFLGSYPLTHAILASKCSSPSPLSRKILLGL